MWFWLVGALGARREGDVLAGGAEISDVVDGRCGREGEEMEDREEGSGGQHDGRRDVERGEREDEAAGWLVDENLIEITQWS